MSREAILHAAEGIFYALGGLAIAAIGVHAGGTVGLMAALAGFALAGIYGGLTGWMLLTVWKLRD